MTAALLEIASDRRVVKLAEAATTERARADAASELANLYGGIVAVFLDGTGEAALGVTHQQVAAAIARHGTLEVRVTDQGVIACWTTDPTVTDADTPGGLSRAADPSGSTPPERAADVSALQPQPN